MAFTTPIIVRDRCCQSGCDDVTAPSGCYEVFEPGKSLATTNRFWLVADGTVRNALNLQADSWPDDTPYETDCRSVGGGSNNLYVNPSALRAVEWEKLSSCGPYLLTGHFGPTTIDDPATASSTETPNDLRWFETLGYINSTTTPWRIRPCTREFFTPLDGPECLYANGELFDQPAAFEFESPTATACDISVGPNDLIGRLTSLTSASEISWRIDASQINIVVQYYDDVGAVVYTATIPFTRNWWLDVLDLFDVSNNLKNVYDCDSAPCDPISCLPVCVVKDCEGTNYHRPLYLTVSGCPDLAALAPETFPTVDGGGFQSGTFGYGVTSPPGEPPVALILIQYSCNGSGDLVREVFVDDTDGASYTNGPTVVGNTCAGGSWSDTFTLDLVDCGITTFDVFSDGSDPWSPV